MTHGHTEPAHSTPLFTGPEGQGFAQGPAGVTQQPLGTWDYRGGVPCNPEITSTQRDSSRHLGSGYKLYSVTNSTEPLGLLQWWGIPLSDPQNPLLATCVVCGSWNMAQGPS